MRIALFEDNNEHALMLVSSVEKWAVQNGKKAVITRFSSAFEAKELSSFDCLFLDVEMPGMDGVEFAREIRSSGSSIPIVFISSYTEYSIDGYEVNALRFIDKNASDFKRRLFECMDKTAYEVENSLNANYHIRSNHKLVSIPLHEIVLFEVHDHYIVVHAFSGVFKERKTFSALKAELPKQFVQIGRSQVINVLQATQITKSTVVLRNGVKLSVAPNYSSSLFEAFLDMR